MRITFGMGLDGWRAPRGADEMGHLVCGPTGLVSALELRLGLAAPAVSPARRAVQYQEALGLALSGGERFYGTSFGKDPLSAAETLLAWRDDLRMAGWRGDCLPDDPPRLRDLAEVESHAKGKLAPGLGDRIEAIMEAMGHRSPLIEKVEVVDAEEQLPALLRLVLVRLGAVFGSHALTPSAPAGTNLGRLQEALVSGTADRIAWSREGDDSLQVWTAGSEAILARAVAQLLERIRGENAAAVLVAPSFGRPLDAALAAMDGPVLAMPSPSRQRAILQVLPLALRLRWQPVNPAHLLEFLSHAVSPIRNGLRYALARAVAEFPGIGSEKWIEELQHFRARIEENEPDAGRRADALARIERDLADWIEIERFDRAGGAPGARLAETCDRVARWAGARANTGDEGPWRSHFIAAASQAAELADILRGTGSVRPALLERLCAAVLGYGISPGDEKAELGCVDHVREPAAVLGPTQHVIWWGFEAPPVQRTLPWNVQELDALAARGVQPLPVSADLARANAAALRPILAASSTMTLVVPRRRANEPVRHHPLNDRLDALVERGVPVTDIDALIEAQPPCLSIVSLAHRPLQPVRRWWRLADPSKLEPRDEESFSSLNAFVYQPFAWVLGYKARLRPGSLLQNQMASDRRQHGNLMHRVAEHLFAAEVAIDWRTATEEELNRWIDQQWETLLQAEGANLLLPGQKAEAIRLRETTARAMWRLVGALRRAGVVRALADVDPGPAEFITGRVGGVIDLEVERDDGSRAVVDLKAGGRDHRMKELSANVPLQLAVYGYLLRAARGGDWPEGAYYILQNATMLVQNSTFFPDARVVPPKGGNGGLPACWDDFEAVWRWRREQMDAGWIEVPVDGAEPTDGAGPEPSSGPPIATWSHDQKSPRFDDFANLTGWGPHQ